MNAKKAILMGLQQLLAEKRLDDITVQDILNASEVSRRTFYRYYRDKYDVITSYYVDNIAEHQRALTPETMREITKKTILFVMNHRAFFSRAVGQGDVNSLDDTIFRCSLRFCELLRGEAELSEEARFQAEFFAHGCVGIFRGWILAKEPVDADTLTDWLMAMLP